MILKKNSRSFKVAQWWKKLNVAPRNCHTIFFECNNFCVLGSFDEELVCIVGYVLHYLKVFICCTHSRKLQGLQLLMA